MEKEAYKLIMEGKFEDAINILEELRKEGNISRESLFNLALCYYKLERFDSALRIIEEHFDEEKSDEGVLFLKGVILRRVGRLLEAKEIFEKLGFQDLASSIPEPVRRKPLDLKEETLTMEEPEIEEIPVEDAVTELKETEATQSYIILNTNGYISMPRQYFICYVTTNGDISEEDKKIEVTGKGRLYLSLKPRVSDITITQGEKLLDIEGIKIKVEKGEKAFHIIT